MILAMTMMVRDEADIVEAMIEHHLAQGVDVIIATDNGSIDGTLEVLKSYAAKGVVDLREDPLHNKQQGKVVTEMARDAYLLHEADWVLNADADEFWLPVDRALSLKAVFEQIPRSLQSFTVPVIDMTGEPSASGSGLSRLIYRDTRPITRLREVGLLAHSTHDAAHIGSPDVVVAQGNHYVSLESMGQPSPELAIEVLHLPWRSWEQYSGKVDRAGAAYGRSGLTPSPNHHGMRDYRRLQNGTLFSYYVARHPDKVELETGIAEGTLTQDDALTRLREPMADVPLDRDIENATRITAHAVIQTQTRLETAEAELEELRALTKEIEEDRNRLRNVENDLRQEIGSLQSQLNAISSRRSVRIIDGATRRARQILHRGRRRG